MVKYRCKYCDGIMSEYDYTTYNDYCGKCREIKEIKSTLKHKKELEG